MATLIQNRVSVSFRLFVAMTVCIACLAAPPIRADDASKHTASVQKDVEWLLRATYDGDAEALLRHTHPKVIELLGGVENARPVLEASLAVVQKLDMKLLSLTFPEPPRFFKGDSSLVVFVPTLIRLSARDGRTFESLNFQAGSLEKGESGWKYVEGSRLHPSNIAIFFPELPPNTEMPKTYRREVQ